MDILSTVQCSHDWTAELSASTQSDRPSSSKSRNLPSNNSYKHFMIIIRENMIIMDVKAQVYYYVK